MENMLKFKSFLKEDATLQQLVKEHELVDLQEATAKPKSKVPAPSKTPVVHPEGKVPNNTRGVLHELIYGKTLNGGKHMIKHENEHGESPEEAHKRLAATVHPNDYKKIHSDAVGAAHHTMEKLKQTHPGHVITPGHVYHTSKAGDTEKVTKVKASQKEDSSDVMFHSHNEKNPKETATHGKSLKVTTKTSKKVPASSLGKESSGEAVHKLHDEHKKDLLAKYPSLAKVKKQPHHEDLAGARKEWLTKQSPKTQADIKKRNQTLLHRVAHAHAAELQQHLNSGNHEHVIKHISDVLSAKRTPAEKAGKSTFEKVTTYQSKSGAKHHSSHPVDDHAEHFKDGKHLSVSSSGGSVHFYHHDPKTGEKKKFATQSHKFDSQSDPLSSLKTAGKEA